LSGESPVEPVETPASTVIAANAGISEPDPEPESGTVLIPAHHGSSPTVERVETPADDLDTLDRRSSGDFDTLDQPTSDEPDQPAFRRGVRLALDWGKVRIGVASCDPDGTLAYPVETVQTHQAARRLPQLLAEYEPIEVIVGLPRTLAGDEGPAAGYVRAQVASLIAANPQVSWRFSDERLTTVDASRRLRSAGRDAKRQRAVIDQAAAVAILEQALVTERATGAAPGEPA
jgi:putative Holliday junction resolvase